MDAGARMPAPPRRTGKRQHRRADEKRQWHAARRRTLQRQVHAAVFHDPPLPARLRHDRPDRLVEKASPKRPAAQGRNAQKTAEYAHYSHL